MWSKCLFWQIYIWYRTDVCVLVTNSLWCAAVGRVVWVVNSQMSVPYRIWTSSRKCSSHRTVRWNHRFWNTMRISSDNLPVSDHCRCLRACVLVCVCRYPVNVLMCPHHCLCFESGDVPGTMWLAWVLFVTPWQSPSCGRVGHPLLHWMSPRVLSDHCLTCAATSSCSVEIFDLWFSSWPQSNCQFSFLTNAWGNHSVYGD